MMSTNLQRYDYNNFIISVVAFLLVICILIIYKLYDKKRLYKMEQDRTKIKPPKTLYLILGAGLIIFLMLTAVAVYLNKPYSHILAFIVVIYIMFAESIILHRRR